MNNLRYLSAMRSDIRYNVYIKGIVIQVCTDAKHAKYAKFKVSTLDTLHTLIGLHTLHVCLFVVTISI